MAYKNKAAYKRYQKRWKSKHLPETKMYNERYRNANHAVLRAYQRKLAKIIKAKIYAAYGNKCACCGETNSLFFQIDHVHGKGNQHRRLLFGSTGGTRFYRWLIKNKYPSGFQILCANCHVAKHRGYPGAKHGHRR